jgi:D-inositol-3-phosphate glycosyltransferase
MMSLRSGAVRSSAAAPAVSRLHGADFAPSDAGSQPAASDAARRRSSVASDESRGSSLALIVDITGTSVNYNHGLANALAAYPEVVFRTAPYFGDRNAFRESLLRRDFLRTAAWLADRWPGIVHHHRLWKAVQLHGYLSGWRDALRELKRRKVPVLHIQWCKVPVLDAWLMKQAQAQGIRVVYTVHNALPYSDRRELVRRAYRKLYRQADALVVLSRFVGQQLLEWVDDSVADKIHVIEHGLLEPDCPLPEREDARQALKLEADAEVVLFVGRISAYKGIADLIDAFEIARRDRPRLRLLIAGDPEDSFQPYQAQIERLGLSPLTQVHPRFVSEEFKSTLYAAADLAMLPHREASQSGMGLEALAAGKPIVATQVGGLMDLVVEDVNGYGVPVSDPTAMAGALTRFFGQSRQAQAAMAAASRTLGQDRFAWSSIAQRHVALYRRIAAAAPSAEHTSGGPIHQ